MEEGNNQQLKEIQLAAEKLLHSYNTLAQKKIDLSSNIDRVSSALFYFATLSGFVAIFSQFWVGMLSLSFALIASVLLIYKSKTKLNNTIDINLWLTERSQILLKKSLVSQAHVNGALSNEHVAVSVSEYLNELDRIIADADAHNGNQLNSSLSDFYELRSHKNRYAAARKNKYNRHGIQDIG